MSNNDVAIKLSLEGAQSVQQGLAGVGDGAVEADSKLTGMVNGGLKGVGVAFVGLTAAAGAAGAALSVAVVKAYADAEQSVGGIETLFGTSADKMKSYAADAYATAGLSANEYMEQATSMSASLIQSVGGDTAKAAELANTALVAMSDNANKMGTDLGSIQNAFSGFAKGNYTMLDNLKLGYGGTQEEMARLLSDAEKLPSAMGQKFDLSNYGDVVTAVQLIQEEMGIAGTTAQEASTTISGSVGMLRGSFDNLLVAMGSANNESLAFLDVQEQAANVISSFETVVGNVEPVISSLGGALSSMGPQLGTMLEGLTGTVAGVIPSLLQAGVGMIGGLVSGITSALPSLIPALLPGILSLVEMVATQAPLLLDAGIQAVIALGMGLVEAIPTLLPLVVTMVTGLADTIVSNLPMLLDVALQIVMALGLGLVSALPILVAALPGLITGIINFLVGAIPQIITTGVTLLVSLIQALPQIISMIVSALPQIINSLIKGLLGAIPQLIQAGIQLFVAIVKALPEIITSIVRAIPQIIVGIVSALISALPELVKGGLELFLGIVGGLIEALPQIIEAVLMMGPEMVDALIGMAPMLGQAGLDLINGLVGGLSDSGQLVIDKLLEIANGAISAFKNFFGIKSPSTLMASYGVFMMQGLGNGIAGGGAYAMQSLEEVQADLLSRMESYQKDVLQAQIAYENLRKQSTKGLSAAEKKLRKIELDEARQAYKDLKKVNLDKLADKLSSVNNKLIEKEIKDQIKLEKDLYKAQRTEEVRYQKEYLKAALDEARNSLTALQSERTKFIQSIQKTVTDSVSLIGLNYAGEMKGVLQNQINDVRAFRAKLDQLQKMGLDDTSRDQLLQDFLKNGSTAAADVLLDAGPAAVKEIADLRETLSKEGKLLGTTVADDMYNAGIQAAQGIVDGLESQSKALAAVAKSIGKTLVDEVKKELKIKSPSEIFEDEVGLMIPPGIGLGVAKSMQKAIDPLRSLNAQMVLEAKQAAPLTAQAAQATQIPLLGATPTVTPRFDMYGAFQAMESRLRGQQTPVMARIDPDDMTTMARQVGGAMVDIRNADNYDMTSAIQRGDF